MANLSLLTRPPETMWAAAMRLWNEAQRDLDLDKRDRALKLYQTAVRTNARGIPFTLTTYRLIGET